jgi:hypothetical protein
MKFLKKASCGWVGDFGMGSHLSDQFRK